jgi:hypothetical protein
MLLRLLLSLLLAIVASCGSSAHEPVREPDDLRILFIGNSLTFANDLPGLVQRLGRSDPSRAVVVGSVAYSNYSLQDHWNRGDALEAIASGSWDLVVLQQGPSALPESRVLLIEYATRFAEAIRGAGAQPAIYMVWPPLSRESEWDAVTASHVAAAEAVDGVLLPGGEALRAARASGAGITLFQSDDFHPSLEGSYAVALVVYGEAAHVSPIGLSERAGGIDLPASTVAALEAAAGDAIGRFTGP